MPESDSELSVGTHVPAVFILRGFPWRGVRSFQLQLGLLGPFGCCRAPQLPAHCPRVELTAASRGIMHCLDAWGSGLTIVSRDLTSGLLLQWLPGCREVVFVPLRNLGGVGRALNVSFLETSSVILFFSVLGFLCVVFFSWKN